MSVSIENIQSLKNSKKKFSAITAYDYSSAKIIDSTNVPIVLVGDSASMITYGYSTTLPVTMNEMLMVVRAVSRGVSFPLVVADMPFMSYQSSVSLALKNAGLLLKEGGAQAVKLEGGTPYISHRKAIIDAGIPVMGHVGLLPQSYHLSSGYRVQGKTKLEADKIYADALAVQEGGAFAVVLEGIPKNLAKKITKSLNIPTIGIGAGPHCDGQIQVYHDILGLYGDITPRHTKRYGDLKNQIQSMLNEYKNDVEKKIFPSPENYVITKIISEKTL